MSAKRFLRDLYGAISDDNVFNGAAALGFYLTLAIFPAFIVVMTALPYLPLARVDEAIMDLLGQALPEEAYEMVAEVVAHRAARRPAVVQPAGDAVGGLHRHVCHHAAAQHHL